jgi:dienelactone hydrolase
VGGSKSVPEAGASDATTTSDSGAVEGGATTDVVTGGNQRGPDPTQATASAKGPYKVTRYSSGIPASTDYAGWDVDYPADATPPFAGIVVIPGFIEGRSAVGDWGPFLASHGFAVMTIDPVTNGDQPPARAKALWAAVGSLKGENTRSGSALVGKIDAARFAVMGHSMGGGGTLECATAHSDLKAAVPLAPWDSGAMFAMDTVPTMIMAGQSDSVAPIAQHATPFYASIPASTHKAYVEFTGGDHFVADSPVTNTTAGLLGLSWLEIYLEGDMRYAQFLKTQMTLSKFMSSP